MQKILRSLDYRKNVDLRIYLVLKGSVTFMSVYFEGEESICMHALISEKLRNHLQRIGSAVLTVTLEPLRC